MKCLPKEVSDSYVYKEAFFLSLNLLLSLHFCPPKWVKYLALMGQPVSEKERPQFTILKWDKFHLAILPATATVGAVHMVSLRP